MKRADLLKVRKEKGLTQEEIAKNTGINRSYYGLIENGNRNPSLKIAIRIAGFLNVQLKEIFTDEMFFIEKCYSMHSEGEGLKYENKSN